MPTANQQGERPTVTSYAALYAIYLYNVMAISHRLITNKCLAWDIIVYATKRLPCPVHHGFAKYYIDLSDMGHYFNTVFSVVFDIISTILIS